MAKKEKKTFDYAAQLRRLKADGPQRLYLLCGEEVYLRQAFFEELKSACLGDADRAFNDKRLTGGEDLGELSQAVDAMPFFAGRTFVEVWDFDPSRFRDASWERLKAILSDIPDYCTVALLTPAGASPDGRLASVRALKKLGQYLEFTPQEGPALTGWIGKRFAALGKTISRKDAEYLIFCAGGLMNGLLPEIEKLAAGTEGSEIARRDIDAMVQRLPEAEVFDLTDMLSAGRFDDAAQTLAQLLAMREEPIKLLALIGMQMRRVFAVKLAAEERRSREETMELSGVRYDFILQKLRQSAKRYTLPQLADILDMCARYDYKMKSTGLDSGALLREFFAELAAV